MLNHWIYNVNLKTLEPPHLLCLHVHEQPGHWEKSSYAGNVFVFLSSLRDGWKHELPSANKILSFWPVTKSTVASRWLLALGGWRSNVFDSAKSHMSVDHWPMSTLAEWIYTTPFMCTHLEWGQLMGSLFKWASLFYTGQWTQLSENMSMTHIQQSIYIM